MTAYKTPKDTTVPKELFDWPIITKEDEDAVLDVLRDRAMSGTSITDQFQKEFAEWIGCKYGMAFTNGTMSLEAAMFAVGLKEGDELICPSKTYWASCIQAYRFGATVVFADIEADTLCLDPEDFERKITPRTKAVMVVHYLSMPAKIDKICEIAKKHNIKVIEDVSHAQGGLYKGKKLGTFGDVAAMSLMSGKSFATGEMGIMVTDDREMLERAMVYCHYERNTLGNLTTEYLKPYVGMPLGAMKGRVNQMCSAMGLVQLKHYDERCAEIRKAMNYFFDLIKDIKCIQPVVANEAEGSNNAGYYCTHAIYHPEHCGGLSLVGFCRALVNEGFPTYPGGNSALHTHEYFIERNAIAHNYPSKVFLTADAQQALQQSLPVTENTRIFQLPWFKKFMPEYIELYANAVRKVVENYKDYLENDDPEADKKVGRWFFSGSKAF